MDKDKILQLEERISNLENELDDMENINQNLHDNLSCIEDKYSSLKEEYENEKFVKNYTLTDIEKIEFLKENWINITIEDLENMKY